MGTIFSLRGPGGAGKTTTVYGLLDRFPSVEHYSPTWTKGVPKSPRAFELPGDLYVLGRYTGANCSGVDGWFPDRITMLIEHFAPKGHVLLESLIMSSSMKTFMQFKDTYPLVFIYLDTPVETCIQQIYKRNGGKPIKEDDIRSHHRTIVNQRGRVEAMGVTTEVVRSGPSAVDDLVAAMRKHGWNPAVEVKEGWKHFDKMPLNSPKFDNVGLSIIQQTDHIYSGGENGANSKTERPTLKCLKYL